MTRRHRRAHLVIWLVLGPALLVVLVGSIIARERLSAALATSGARP